MRQPTCQPIPSAQGFWNRHCRAPKPFRNPRLLGRCARGALPNRPRKRRRFNYTLLYGYPNRFSKRRVAAEAGRGRWNRLKRRFCRPQTGLRQKRSALPFYRGRHSVPFERTLYALKPVTRTHRKMFQTFAVRCLPVSHMATLGRDLEKGKSTILSRVLACMRASSWRVIIAG